MSATAVVRFPKDVTKEWLSTVLRAEVSNFEINRVGTGQVSAAYRITLEYGHGTCGPPSAILKVPSDNNDSKQAAALLGLYEREVRFYQEVAPLMHSALAGVLSSAYYVADGTFHLLLEDASPCHPGNDIKGATIEQARLAMQELGKLHAPTLNNHDLEAAKWLKRPNGLGAAMFEGMFAEWVQRYEKRVAPEHMALCKKFVENFEEYVAMREKEEHISGIIHADYRLDNMLFGEVEAGGKRPLTVVDWQTVTWGPAMTDVAYFLGCSLTTGLRRQHYEELLKIYHDNLGPNPEMTLDEVRDGVKKQSFFGILMNIVSPIFVEQTERGDNMFMTMMERAATMVLDLDADKDLDNLPSNAEANKALAPQPQDESVHFHEPGDHPLWQESWYFDFADDMQGIGGYVRLGIDPSRKRSWYTTVVCGPDRPSIAFQDFRAPVPNPKDPSLRIKTEAYEATQQVNEALKELRVAVSGTAESFDDPAGLLRGDQGKPANVSLDLVWHTDGTPYTYRVTTRYEIPCKVSGRLTIGDDKFELNNVLGQRDHSWGPRDWWSMDWIWSAFHLHDGTHIHGVDLRIPSAPRMSVGYIQSPIQPITELKHVVGKETFPEPTGLPTGTVTTISTEAAGGKEVVLDLEIRAHGPLRLQADDGRIGLFPRAWGKVKTADGRTGVGWMEWMRNRYQKP